MCKIFLHPKPLVHDIPPNENLYLRNVWLCRGSNISAYENLKVESQELRNQQKLLISQLADVKVRLAEPPGQVKSTRYRTDWYKWIRTFFFIAFRSFDRIRLHSLACAKISAGSLTPLIQALSINNKLSGVVVTAEADTMVSFCQRGCAPPVSPPPPLCAPLNS